MVIFSYLISGAVGVLLLLFLLGSRFTPTKPPLSQQILCIGGCWALLCLSSHWALLIPAGCMAAGAVAYFWGNASLPKAFSFSVLFGALYAAGYGIAQILSNLFPNVDAVNIQLIRLTVLFAVVIVAVLCSRLWKKALLPIVQLLPIWIIGALMCSLCVWSSGRMGVSILQFFSLLWQLYCGISLWTVYRQIQQRLDAARQQQDIQRQYAMQAEYYQALQEKQTQTRALWHDLSKYLRAAKAETAPSEALEQLQTMLDDATAIVDVGNPVVNVILNEYTQSAKALGIELRLKVQIPEKLGISAADLYVIIGNTMDNAIEACRDLPQPQRLIDLTLRTQGDILYYRLANPYGLPKHQPNADSLRGYGLDNVRRCVEAYGGQLLTQQSQGFFIVSAHLNQLPSNNPNKI